MISSVTSRGRNAARKRDVSMNRNLAGHPGLETAIVFFSCAAISLYFGLSFGSNDSNHPVYLIDGLRRVNPHLLQGDWWSSNTTHYHHRFTILVSLLEKIGFLQWGLALGNIACIVVTFYTVYRIIRVFCSINAYFTWLLFIVLFVGFSGAQSVAGSYFFSSSLQPSSIATCLLVVGIGYYVTGNLLLSGIAVALSGFFHTNFLILAFPFFCLAHLLSGGKYLTGRLLRQFVPPVIVLVVELPNTLNTMGLDLPDEVRARANDIFINIAAPHHYFPEKFLIHFIPLIGWSLCVLPCIIKFFGSPVAEKKQTVSLYLSFTFLIAVATLATVFFHIDAISRLFIWRMAPFILMLSHILLAGISASILLRKEGVDFMPSTVWGFGFLPAGFLVVSRYFWYFERYDVVLYLLAWLLLISIVWFGKKRMNYGPRLTRLMRHHAATIKIVFAAFLCLVFMKGIGEKDFSLLFPERSEKSRFYAWARSRDPQSSFLIPPSLSQFRLQTEKAVIVDWKARPLRPDEIVAWYERINDISGGIGPKSLKEANEGYKNLSMEYVKRLWDTYHFDYYVQYRSSGEQVIPSAEFMNDTFYVLSMKEALEAGHDRQGDGA